MVSITWEIIDNGFFKKVVVVSVGSKNEDLTQTYAGHPMHGGRKDPGMVTGKSGEYKIIIRLTYPLKVVRLAKRSGGIVGSRGTLISYKTKKPIKAKPMINGARTCAEDQGYRTPPKVRPMIAKVVPAMTMAFPLWTNRRVLIALESVELLTSSLLGQICSSLSLRVCGHEEIEERK